MSSVREIQLGVNLTVKPNKSNNIRDCTLVKETDKYIEQEGALR
jgi:hypothetical protein